MKYLDLKTAIILHDIMIDEIGGLKGYNDKQIGLLDSALEHVKNDDYYPTLLEKLTHVIFSCVKFHSFLDGNKRTAIFLGIAFLELNELSGYASALASELEDAVVAVAENKMSKDELKTLLEQILY